MFREILIFPIRFYQKYISPFFGPKCRFMPTCSQYAVESLQIHGAFKGMILSLFRICRCQPFCKNGYDPVPEKGAWRHRTVMTERGD
ncbi:MAG: membrane protein insertion efficiency factor YidD [Planctomycetes bacterium]|nr:membrane protein insertion efficiency factor YidD [Planctomycetota bacterium]